MPRKPAKSPVFNVLAENLRLARGYHRWTQEQFAEQCGVKRTYIAAVEAGSLNLGIENLERLAKGLNVPSYVLLMPVEEAQQLLFAASREKKLTKR